MTVSLSIRKHWHIFTHFTRQSLSRELQFRGNAISSYLVTICWSLMRVFYFVVAFDHITLVRDWTYEKSLVLAACFMITHGFFRFLFEQNQRKFVANVHTGEVDQLLTKPVSSLFTLSLRQSELKGFIRFCFGILIVAWVIWSFKPDLSLTNYLAFFWALSIGISLFYSITFSVLTFAFKLGYIRNLHMLSNVFLSMSYMPYDIFPQVMTEIITFVVPLIFLNTIPAKMLFEPNLSMLLTGTFMSATSFVILLTLWNHNLKNYSSVSS